MEKRAVKKEFTKGIWAKNPLFVVLLGLCPALAATTSVKNGLAMGVAVIFVMTLSNIIISALRNQIPRAIRIPCFILIIASFVTIAELLMKAYLPSSINESLGIFIPLIVVNCVIMYRAEDFASKNNIFYSAIDGAGMGIGFTLALIIVSAIREALGEGTIFGIKIAVNYQPAVIFIMAPGAFLTLGLLLAFFNWQRLRKKERLQND